MSFGINGRKVRSRAVSHPAWLPGHGGKLFPCTIANITEDGAQLCVSENIILPGRFELWLTQNGQARRGCRLIWRKADRLGVRFIKLPESLPERVLVD